MKPKYLAALASGLACVPRGTETTSPRLEPASTTAPPKATAHEAEPDPSAGLRTTCKRLEVLSPDEVVAPLAEFAKAGGDASVLTDAPGFGRCVMGPADSSGAWLLRPLYLVANETDLGPSIEGSVSLEFISSHGEHFVDELSGGLLFEVALIPPDYGIVATASIAAVLDYNHDGINEAVFSVEESGYDHHDFVWGIATAQTDPAAREQQDFYLPYEPSGDIPIADVLDFDKDGRPDLVSETEYWSADECYGMSGSPPFGNPPVLYHAAEDGTFDPSDDVAAAFLRTQCPHAPDRLVIAGDDAWIQSSKKRIACARIWGMSEDDARAQVQREWNALRRTADDVSACGDSIEPLLQTTEIEPPLVLMR